MKKTIKVYSGGESYLKKHEYLDFDNLLGMTLKDAKRNVLTIANGKTGYANIIYVSKSGKPYTAELKLNDNPYLLVNYLANYPNKLFAKDEIKGMAGVLKPISGRAFDQDDERRVRDTMATIRYEMELKNNKQDDPFVSAGGFGLMCDIERKS